MFDQEHLEKMREGIRLFNEQMYWECHEALEDAWMEDRNDPVRNVYWAVIQVAAALIHYRDHNLVGAKGMIYKAKEKFRRCRDQHLLSELAFKELRWNEFEKLALEIPDDCQLSDFDGLWAFRF